MSHLPRIDSEDLFLFNQVSGELVSSYWMKSNITKSANMSNDLFYEQPPSLSN